MADLVWLTLCGYRSRIGSGLTHPNSNQELIYRTEIDTKTDTVFDLVILQAKQCMYKCKLNKCLPTLSCFLQLLMLKYKLDEYNAKISGELSTFNLNWLCYKPVLTIEN